MIVLDTNVVSELMKALPARVLAEWVRGRRPAELFTTAVTLAEVRYTIARLPEGRRKENLRRAADAVFSAFPEQVLPFDATGVETVDPWQP